MLQAFGCLINSVIHCIMYSHYFFTSFGYENPFKKFITQAQLIQFAMCIVHALCVLGFEVVLPRPYAWAQFVYHIQVRYRLFPIHHHHFAFLGTACTAYCSGAAAPGAVMTDSPLCRSDLYSPATHYIPFAQMLVLFGHFYRKSYLAARSAKRQAGAAKPEVAAAGATGARPAETAKSK
jgi:hypothetical protein